MARRKHLLSQRVPNIETTPKDRMDLETLLVEVNRAKWDLLFNAAWVCWILFGYYGQA